MKLRIRWLTMSYPCLIIHSIPNLSLSIFRIGLLLFGSNPGVCCVLYCGCKVNFTLQRRCAVKNRIEEIRKDRGVRQEEFAKALGVSRQTISSLETGRYNPSIFLAWKIARYFGMTIEEVFIFEEDDLNGGNK